MRSIRPPLLLALVLSLAFAVTGCGGDDGEGSAVSADAIAVVGETQIAKADYDALVSQAKKGYEAQKRKFPKAGTPEFKVVQNQLVGVLVQREQYQQKAGELDIAITDADVDKRLKRIKQQYFGGNDKRYRASIKQQGLNDAEVRKILRDQVIQEKIYARVTKDVKVSDADVQAYYKKNQAQYRTPESRDVRHILVSSKKQADDLYGRIKGGEDFATLARKFSKDPGSKTQGGKLTISRGQTVPEFDKTAFLLDKGELSKPVKTTYGFHLIEPLTAVRPAKTTPLAKVEKSIRVQLLQTKKSEAMTRWVEQTRDEFKDETRYQVGFKPPETPTTSTGTSTASE
ncbi:MAG: peptidylprolyl isomerase [Actinobacteria bacterium]|nr:peptidylprolyl isomerase [Actinomycetota bacterium]